MCVCVLKLHKQIVKSGRLANHIYIYFNLGFQSLFIARLFVLLLSDYKLNNLPKIGLLLLRGLAI